MQLVIKEYRYHMQMNRNSLKIKHCHELRQVLLIARIYILKHELTFRLFLQSNNRILFKIRQHKI